MAYTVRTLPRAEFDAQPIYDWIKDRSPDGARRRWAAYEAAAQSLVYDPVSHALAPESEEIGGDVRQMLFKTRHGRYYRALYVVVGDEVRVLRVRGPGQSDLSSDERF